MTMNTETMELSDIQSARGGGETANNCIKKCAKVFTKDIGVKVTEADIDVAHRIGPPPPKGRSRPIIVRFLSRQARDKRQKPQEQGSGSWGGSDQSQLQSAAGRRKTLGHLGSVVVQW